MIVVITELCQTVVAVLGQVVPAPEGGHVN